MPISQQQVLEWNTMTTPSGYSPYTDRQAWRADFRAFIDNEAPIVRTLAKPAPLITLHPDRGLVSLFRAHWRTPEREGDVAAHYMLSCDVPIPEADLAIKFTWAKPTVYTMTLALKVPDCLEWLSPALQVGVLACGLAPHPELGYIMLPLPPDLQGQLVRLALSNIYHLQRRKRAA
jgi:hypothetical protein